MYVCMYVYVFFAVEFLRNKKVMAYSFFILSLNVNEVINNSIFKYWQIKTLVIESCNKNYGLTNFIT